MLIMVIEKFSEFLVLRCCHPCMFWSYTRKHVWWTHVDYNGLSSSLVNCWYVSEFVVVLTGLLEHARRVTPLNLSFLKQWLVHWYFMWYHRFGLWVVCVRYYVDTGTSFLRIEGVWSIEISWTCPSVFWLFVVACLKRIRISNISFGIAEFEIED